MNLYVLCSPEQKQSLLYKSDYFCLHIVLFKHWYIDYYIIEELEF